MLYSLDAMGQSRKRANQTHYSVESNGPLSIEVLGRKKKLQAALLNWGATHLREFPWREPGRNPYEVLVAELLLKRTTTTAAARLYLNFLSQYPSVTALQTATIEELETKFAVVGLQKQRARSAHSLAGYLVDTRGGQVPSTLEELLRVPGLGAYGARAVLSFGFGKPAAVVDSNVTRVWARVFSASALGKIPLKKMQAVADAMLPPKRHQEFNYALLDLSATVCRYGGPRCAECPLMSQCDTAATGYSRGAAK